jgi:hypothetical protein
MQIDTEYFDRLPHCAGVRYNQGLAYVLANRAADAIPHFGKSLADCINYTPAFDAACACYEELGQTEQLAALRKMWGVPDEEDTEPTP